MKQMLQSRMLGRWRQKNKCDASFGRECRHDRKRGARGADFDVADIIDGGAILDDVDAKPEAGLAVAE